MIKCEETTITCSSSHKGVKMMKPKEFKKYCETNSATVIGYTYLEDISKKKVSDECLCIGDKMFMMYEKTVKNAKGYIPVTDTKFVAFAKTRLPLHIAATVCAVCLASYGFYVYQENKPKPNMWNGGVNNSASMDGESIAIPGYVAQTVTEDSPYIALGNPEVNDVYFTYHIFEDGDEVYTSDYISPGQKEDWDAYNMIAPGEHTYKFWITTCDLEDKDIPYNSADMEVRVTR